MTSERKKGKYVYYRCTGFKGACGNVYIRQEKLADFLGDFIKPTQITTEIANDIATVIRESDGDAQALRATALQQVENRRRTVVSKIDRGYEDYVSDRISEAFAAVTRHGRLKPRRRLPVRPPLQSFGIL